MYKESETVVVDTAEQADVQLGQDGEDLVPHLPTSAFWYCHHRAPKLHLSNAFTSTTA